MAERMMYQPTEKQAREWAQFSSDYMESIPSDDWFKAEWKRCKGGKTQGWGIFKRDWITRQMTATPEYQRGIWQGRVDAARGIEYAEDRSENTYNLGYYRGYTEYESNRRGWDKATRERFDAAYLSDLQNS